MIFLALGTGASCDPPPTPGLDDRGLADDAAKPCATTRSAQETIVPRRVPLAQDIHIYPEVCSGGFQEITQMLQVLMLIVDAVCHERSPEPCEVDLWSDQGTAY